MLSPRPKPKGAPLPPHLKLKGYVVLRRYLKFLGINDICNHFAEPGVAVGMTTIYRHLDKLVEEGTVKKYILDASTSACYEYVDTHSACEENGCTHLKCTNCGKLIHLYCDDLKATERHILEEHGFKADMTRTVICGLCENCQ